MTMALLGEKQALREKVTQARQALTTPYRQQASAKMAAAVQALEVYKAAQSIFLYASMSDEVQLYGLLEAALQVGKAVTLPRITGKRTMEPVRLFALADLVPGKYGIKTVNPAQTEVFPADRLDLIIVPGAAFDEQGRRLGLGGGFYDVFMADKAPQAYRLALAFDCQLVAAVPVEPHDVSVDMILTESKCLKVSDK